MAKPPLTYTTPDVDGRIPDFNYIGTKAIHSGNGKTYTITGFGWNCIEDRWDFVYSNPDSPVPFHRTIANSLDLLNDVPRFTFLPKE